MNGAVYISFFQGQLESVLEQVVQLAVQEISKTVGSSLNTLLLETAVKEQENRQLRLRLQSRENRSRASSAPADGGGDSSVAGKNKAGKAAGHGRADGGGADPEQRQQQQLHVPGGQGIQAGVPTDARRLEQRGRVVDQLKSVMEQVLDFAVRELTKIVEASFDDLLLEITKMDKEQQGLEERLGHRGGGAGGRRRGSENDSVSPSGSEDAREEVLVSKDDRERPPILSVSQDWVPILDKVFGQKWCNDIRELEGGGGRGLGEPLSAHPLTLEPSPSSPQQDPRWTPLEDMEVFSPDDVAAESRRSVEGGLSSGSAAGGRRRGRQRNDGHDRRQQRGARRRPARRRPAARTSLPVAPDNQGGGGRGGGRRGGWGGQREEEEEAEGLVRVRGVRSEVQSDVPPQGPPSDSHRRERRRRRHGVALVSAQQRRRGPALFAVRQEVLLCDPPPQPHPGPALNRTGSGSPGLNWEQKWIA